MELLAIVEAALLDADLLGLHSRCDDENPSATLLTATAWIVQWRSVVWCRGTGIHPDTEAIAVEYEAVRLTFV